MDDTIIIIILAVGLCLNAIAVIMLCNTLKRGTNQLIMMIAQFHSEYRQNFEIQKNIENFKIGSLKYVLIGTRMYIQAIMQNAVQEERYEEAQQCKNAIIEIQKLIDF